MKIVDLNILLYAVNRDAHHHRRIGHWWEKTLNGEEPIGLCWIVLTGFLRLATSPRVFPKPLNPQEAIERLDAWLSHPNCKLVVESEEHWRTLRGLLADSGTSGNLTTDAHLASIAITHGAVLVSCDSDFSRFAHLRWENPLRV